MTGFPWGSLATEIALLSLAMICLMADIAIVDRARKHWIGYLAMAGLLLCLLPAAGVCAAPNASENLFDGLYRSDDFHRFFRLLVVTLSALVVLLSMDYLEHLRIDRGVYFTLIVTGALAMILLAGSNDIVMLYLSFEFLSINSYILVGYLLGRDKGAIEEIKRSTEASLKYLIYGAVAAAVMLYGLSLMYGMAGSTRLTEIALVYGQSGNELVKLMAVAMVLVGMGFKIGAAPFHQWVPDVYEGAPTPIAAWLAVGSKGAAFAVLARFFILGLGIAEFSSPALDWRVFLSIIAVVTMFAGNLLAILQSNIKRMLGYSSVAHAGYMLVAVICNFIEPGNGPAATHLEGIQAVLIYLAAYLLMTLGAFAVVVWYQRSSGSERIDDYAGLAQRAPLIAAAMLIFMLSLTGIPPTVGFIGKLLILRSTIIASGWWWLGLAIVINSVISAFYYMNVVRVMYLRPPQREFSLRPAFASPVVIAVCAVTTLLAGLFFTLLLDLSAAPMSTFLR